MVKPTAPDWQLLESILWTPTDGFYLLERHLSRLAGSAAAFGWPVDIPRVLYDLHHRCAGRAGPTKVRLLLNDSGEFDIQVGATNPAPMSVVAVARSPIDERAAFLQHKTTRRAVYDVHLAQAPGAGDVVLWNRRGELTETCLGNLVCRFGSHLLTPPLHCGLLPGTMRAQLLDDGIVREGVVAIADIAAADEIWRINSVRRWTRLQLDPIREGCA